MATKTFFIDSNNADYGQEEFNWVQKFFFTEGVLNTIASSWEDWVANGDLKVVQRGAGANMSVDVKAGWAVVETIRNSVTFKVFAYNQAVANLVVSANGGGSNRVDAVILRIDRDAEPNALMSNIASLQVVTGSGTSPLSDGAIQTALGDSDDFIRLADVTVTPSDTDITDAQIADTRTRALSNDALTYSPTVLRFRNVASDPATANLAVGDMWYNSTSNKLKFYNGTSAVEINNIVYTEGNGIDITANVISAVLKSGGGLEFSTGEIKVIDALMNSAPLKFAGTGGETITLSGSVPIPIYQKDTDGEFYRSDANDTDRLRFDGFLLASTSDGASASVQLGGIVGGFSSLTKGQLYFVQDDGTIGLTPGTYHIQVGKAISATEIQILKARCAAGAGSTLSGTGDSTVDEDVKCGFKPSVIRIQFYVQGHDQSTETNKYKKSAGVACYYGTNKGYSWQFASSTGDASSDLDMINGDVLSHGTMQNPNSGVGGASAGNQGGNGGIVASWSLLTLNHDGFTIRKALDAGSGNGTTGIVRFSWEAFA